MALCPLTRQPQVGLAERIAGSFFTDLAAVDWVPSDEADVFRLTFSSDRRPRFLKMRIAGIGAVDREVRMLPVLHARGFPVLAFEHSTADLADAGVDFHITEEVAHIAGAELVASDVTAARAFAERLGQVIRRLEQLDPHTIAGSVQWNRSSAAWWRPQYRALMGDTRWSRRAAGWAERILAQLDTPPDAFGGWFGEMLIQPSGAFVMIDWTNGGASWRCAQAAVGMEVLAGFGGQRKSNLVRHLLHGYAPTGLRPAELDALRLWTVHSSLGWAMLSPPSDERIRLASAGMDQCLASDDPADWF